MTTTQASANTHDMRAQAESSRQAVAPYPNKGTESSYLYLKNMLDSIADPIFVKDREHRWIDGNKAFWKLMGGPPEKFLGKSDYEFFPKEEADVFWQEDNKVFESGQPAINEEFFTDHQGKTHVLSTTKTVFPNEEGETVLVGVIRDITAQKELEQLEEQRLKADFYNRLEEKVKALQESNYELSRFAWVASHDLQEPLRTVTTYIELLERRYHNKLDKTGKDYIQTVVESVQRLQSLVEDLLVHARVEKVDDFITIDLEDVLRSVKEDLQTIIEESSANITSDSLPTVKGEAALLSQVLQNLLTNAIKFCPKDRTPTIHIACEQRGDEWLLSVRDNGIGIDEEYYQRIFGLFERLHSKADYDGSGIGLASCKKIVELHGGKIWVESLKGQGSCFYFTLPIK